MFTKCFILRFYPRIIVGWEIVFVCVHMRGKWGERKYRRLRAGVGMGGQLKKNQKTSRNNFQERILKIKKISPIILTKLWHLKKCYQKFLQKLTTKQTYRHHQLQQIPNHLKRQLISHSFHDCYLYLGSPFEEDLNLKIALFVLCFPVLWKIIVNLSVYFLTFMPLKRHAEQALLYPLHRWGKPGIK